jgi:hypothetical protein
MKGLCKLTQEGVGRLWTCDKWESALSDEVLLPQYSAQAGEYYIDSEHLSKMSF